MYDGTNYNGYQKQPDANTIQSEVERVLTVMHKGVSISITSSGRTDAGVHAINQVFHFDSDLKISSEAWVRALNAQLPKDIRVTSCVEVESSFHARYDVKEKTYQYKIYNSKHEDVFLRNYSVYFPYELDIGKMQSAANVLKGTHDFTAFCSARSEVEDKVRTISGISIIKTCDEIQFNFIGNGFLYNMVRILVGTLLEVGQGKLSTTDVENILKSRDRRNAPKTAPAHGLYLYDVKY
jgi:tRNA pseudouridine38-40 synthase